MQATTFSVRTPTGGAVSGTTFGVAALAAGVVMALAGSAAAQQFVPIQPLSGDTSSAISGISADGTTVVGVSSRPVPVRTRGFRAAWQSSTNPVVLSGSADEQTLATAVSCNGGAIVGQVTRNGISEAVVWAGGVRSSLGFLATGPGRSSLARAVSCDGQFVAGQSINASGLDEAFLVTRTGSTYSPMQALGFIGPAGTAAESSANGVSATGRVVGRASWSQPAKSLSGFDAFAWDAPAGPMIPLGLPSGFGEDGSASAITSDGDVIVGATAIGDGYGSTVLVPFRASSDGFEPLSPCFEGSGAATAVSADGRIVVGFNNCAGPNRAFVWDPVNGYRLIEDILADAGALPAGWALTLATGISADGTVIVGNAVAPGFVPRGWIAVIPRTDVEPCPACPADFDQDGGVTGSDVEAFFAAFENGESCADTDADGGVTGSDVEAFFFAFENGGC
jgi:uncharacterized membrane protein